MDYEGKKPIIEMKNIVKTFPGVLALNNMTIDLYEGEIHCIVLSLIHISGSAKGS